MNDITVNTILSNEDSKSKKMISLYNHGLSIKDISVLLGTRYNFVYNVISNYTRINDIDLRTNIGVSKKVQIEKLISEGKSNTEVSKLLKTNYNYVYKVSKDMFQK
jgi:transposase